MGFLSNEELAALSPAEEAVLHGLREPARGLRGQPAEDVGQRQLHPGPALGEVPLEVEGRVGHGGGAPVSSRIRSMSRGMSTGLVK